MFMERSILVTWFAMAALISAIPLFLEYSRVSKKYDIIRKPRHRHSNNLFDSHASSKHKDRLNRDKAVFESNKDYEDEEDIEVGFTTTVQPIKIDRVQNHVQTAKKDSIPTCTMRIAETLPASVFDDKDLALNHLPMHVVRNWQSSLFWNSLESGDSGDNGDRGDSGNNWDSWD